MSRALLLVDIQNDFCPGGALPVPEGDRIIPVVNALSPLFKQVIATKDWHPKDHISFASRHGKAPLETIETPYGSQILWPDHCIQESRGADFHPLLDTEPIRHVVHKGTDPEIDSYSAFFDNGRVHKTDLHAYLQEQRVAELVLCGLATDYCVLFSALDALELGYATTVVADGCRGVEVNEGDCARARDRIEQAGGRWIQSAQLREELQERGPG